jgi:hypothetical protein
MSCVVWLCECERVWNWKESEKDSTVVLQKNHGASLLAILRAVQISSTLSVLFDQAGMRRGAKAAM